ncbi:DMT family transporter [Burkholderia sp. BCC0419]|uniref:DMT family transporter n=1 Tax=Burkholderia sp. BCC0419 TaxID=486878 RepID=UPI00158AC345|nr:DMT family transporter [Burkholderia sp. BCC0419]
MIEMPYLISGAPPFLLAILWLALHVACFSANAVAVKATSLTLTICQIIFFRSLATLACSAITRSARVQIATSIKSDVLQLLIIRAIAGFLGIYGVFYTISVLPVPIAMTLTGITPVFVIFLEAVVTNERVRKEILLYALFAIASIYITTSANGVSKFDDLDVGDIAIGLAAGALVAISFVSVRLTVRKVGTNAVVFWFGLGKFVGSLLLGGTAIFATHYTLHETILLSLICFLGAISDFAKTAAYQYGRAWIVSMLSLLAIPASGILAFVFLQEKLFPSQWLGIILMIFSLSAIAYRRNS